MSKTWTITEEDFNRCIGSWLNADNPKYQTYVQGIKLFKEYLEELMENAEQVAKADTGLGTAASEGLNSNTRADKNAPREDSRI